jgi:hypothetical protein
LALSGFFSLTPVLAALVWMALLTVYDKDVKLQLPQPLRFLRARSASS